MERYLRQLRKMPVFEKAAKEAFAGADNKDTFARVTAGVTAPVLFCYVYSIIKKAESRGIKRIYFLARDGFVMRKIAREICTACDVDIDCRYLYCSRFSLRNALYAMCADPDDLEKAGLFGRCARQTAKNTLDRAGITKDDREKIYSDIAYVGDENRALSNAEFDEFCGRLKKSTLFYDVLKSAAKGKYDSIISYFEQEGVFDKTPFALADSGWLGSMQDAFERLCANKLDGKKIQGFYFGLYSKKGENCDAFLFSGENAHKKATRFSNNLFECMCAAPHGMTVGYERAEGRYRPLFAPVMPENVSLAERQIKIIGDFARAVCEKGGIKEEEKTLERLCEKLLRLMYSPSAQEAQALSAFSFCDDVTEGVIEPLCENCERKQLSSLLLHNRILNKLKGRSVYPEKGFYWLYGTIALSDVRPKAFYRFNVRIWEKLRLLREKKRCR